MPMLSRILLPMMCWSKERFPMHQGLQQPVRTYHRRRQFSFHSLTLATRDLRILMEAKRSVERWQQPVRFLNTQHNRGKSLGLTWSPLRRLTRCSKSSPHRSCPQSRCFQHGSHQAGRSQFGRRSPGGIGCSEPELRRSIDGQRHCRKR